jgi:hypothetical protein
MAVHRTSRPRKYNKNGSFEQAIVQQGKWMQAGAFIRGNEQTMKPGHVTSNVKQKARKNSSLARSTTRQKFCTHVEEDWVEVGWEGRL